MTAAELEPPYVLLEDRLSAGGGARLFRWPLDIVRCDRADDVAAAFAAIEAGLARGLHAAGVFSYDLGHVLEPRLTPLLPGQHDDPLLWIGLFEPPLLLHGDAADRLFADCGPPPPLEALDFAHDRATHVARVKELLGFITAGDIYQANLTFPIEFRYGGHPLALYAALRAMQPVAHGGVIATGDRTILSVSPELFVRTRGLSIETRPMKGTAPRGPDAHSDARNRAALLADPKQRAENLMIVDLLRNDLSRIAEPGSVTVPALFTAETYPSFHALTSTIAARLRQGVPLQDRIAALFPCGSIVGAPKIRAAEILGRLEASPRGVYTGAIGAIAPDGDMHLNVAIRTAVVTQAGEGRYGIGGGIVADSDPDAEFDEALLKARILTDLAEDYDLLETFRWSAQDGFVRRDDHLARLARSARQLGFACDPADICRRLDMVVAASRDTDLRVRLTLRRDGRPDVTAEPAAQQSLRPKLAVSPHLLDAADPFLRHKTTRRTPYEAAFAEAQRRGCDEAILLNRQGMVADASRNTLFVEVQGERLTPRIDDGALPGILRADLIHRGVARSATISREMLGRASRLWIGNSLHGLREVGSLDA